VWLIVLFYRDMARPGRDVLRAPDYSDPLGGVLVDDEMLEALGEDDANGPVVVIDEPSSAEAEPATTPV